MTGHDKHVRMRRRGGLISAEAPAPSPAHSSRIERVAVGAVAKRILTSGRTR
jgi:hypothetical protein